MTKNNLYSYYYEIIFTVKTFFQKNSYQPLVYFLKFKKFFMSFNFTKFKKFFSSSWWLLSWFCAFDWCNHVFLSLSFSLSLFFFFKSMKKEKINTLSRVVMMLMVKSKKKEKINTTRLLIFLLWCCLFLDFRQLSKSKRLISCPKTIGFFRLIFTGFYKFDEFHVQVASILLFYDILHGL